MFVHNFVTLLFSCGNRSRLVSVVRSAKAAGATDGRSQFAGWPKIRSCITVPIIADFIQLEK
ncbi:hypothetical protein DXA97_08240 [Clostridium sp. OF09-36]|nr:hypothetical protein DXA97_08240 [Clostridium sp. OF09-36]